MRSDTHSDLQIDCSTCPVRGHQCDDCMVTALLSISPHELPLDAVEVRALDALVGSGLVSEAEAAAATARPERPQRTATWASVG